MMESDNHKQITLAHLCQRRTTGEEGELVKYELPKDIDSCRTTTEELQQRLSGYCTGYFFFFGLKVQWDRVDASMFVSS